MGLLAVWLALGALGAASVMVIHRPVFTDLLVTVVLYTCVTAYTLAGLILWGTRKDRATFAGVRMQAIAAIALAVPATVIVYLLVALADQQPAS